MPDPRVSRLADLVIRYSTEVREGDFTVITGSHVALPLIKELVRAILESGGNPAVYFREEELEEIFYKYARDKQLEFVNPLSRLMIEKADVRISVLSYTHTKYLSTVNPEKIKKRMAAHRELTEIFMKRDAEGSLGWNVVPYPTKALAQEAEMSLVDYEDFVYKACMVDREDPVAAWREQATRQEKIVELLSKVSEIRVVGEKTDLTVRIDGRKWINDDGKKNMPGGEVFTGPIEDSVEGEIYFEYPAIWRGIVVEGIRLKFEKGVIVEAKALKKGEYLKKILETDEGAKRVGEFAFGLNYSITRFTRNILFDEKIGGTLHIAVGAGYPITGSQNKSSIHWDMIKDMRKGKVYADGELIYENGKFLANE
ncbi:MAG: aminopeptidase [Thermoprotei archaeon]|nr:MAG: aminopeptidase [Thermoprotei archaeon]